VPEPSATSPGRQLFDEGLQASERGEDRAVDLVVGDADAEAKEIIESLQTQGGTVREVIGNKYFRKVVFLGIVLQLIQQNKYRLI
jgi:hypothetical protein